MQRPFWFLIIIDFGVLMMTARKAWLGLLFTVLVAAWSTCYAKYDILELPAVKSDLATTSMVYTVMKHGDRYFATGIRGHILYSDDVGETWNQAEVPVRSSILDITFITPDKGWAVGHEAVILHTTDGGETWVKQFDGRMYGKQGLEYYQKLLAEDPDNELVDLLVGEMDFAASQGADKPFFRVVFHSETFGHAMGAYGMLLATFDGGKTWINREHTVDNYAFNHLFDVTKMSNDKFFICGEVGIALEGDTVAQTAVALSSPWEGSFFSCVTAADGAVLMGGLRGNVFRTEDLGRSWSTPEKPVSSTIVDSILMSDGRVLLVGQNGELLESSDNGLTFTTVKKGLGPISSIAEVDPNTLLVAGPEASKK